MNTLSELADSLETKYGRRILNAKDVEDYLGIETSILDRLVHQGSLKEVAKHSGLFSVVSIARFELGIEINSDRASEKAVDEPMVSALSSPNSMEKEMKEEYEMLGVTFTKGSPYENKSRKCFQCAFYYQIDGGEKKRKIVSGATEIEAVAKMKLAKQAIMEQVIRENALNVTSVPNYSGHSSSQSSTVMSQVCAEPPADKRAKCDTPFSTVAESYMELAKAKNADVTYEGKVSMLNNYVLPYFSDMVIGEIRSNDIQSFLNTLQYDKNGKQMSEPFIKNIYTLLKTILNYAYHEEYINRVPIYGVVVPEGVKTNKDEKCFTENDLVNIFRGYLNHQKYMFTSILNLTTGMRSEEFLALKWNDIDFEKKEIRVDEAMIRKLNPDVNGDTKWIRDLGRPKTADSRRVIPIGDVVMEQVKRWKQHLIDSGIMEKAVQRGTQEFVFLDRNGKVQNVDSFRSAYKNFLKRRGLVDINANFHKLRHSYSTWAKSKGVDPMVRKVIMGHSLKDDITDGVYTSLTPEQLEQARTTMNDFVAELTTKAEALGALEPVNGKNGKKKMI